MFGRDDNDNNRNDENNGGDAVAVDSSAAAAATDSDVQNESTDFVATPVASDTVAPSAGRDLPTPSGAGDLLSIKQEALQQLSPLVDHLNQTPEEKFRTTMMMIQATDDQSLIKGAYDAAKSITDDKTRAQALLDIINEINYFTQQQSS